MSHVDGTIVNNVRPLKPRMLTRLPRVLPGTKTRGTYEMLGSKTVYDHGSLPFTLHFLPRIGSIASMAITHGPNRPVFWITWNCNNVTLKSGYWKS